jgi:hypothetical protein
MRLVSRSLFFGCVLALGPDLTVANLQHAAQAAGNADTCDPQQAQISRDADKRAAPWSIQKHLAKNFADHKIAWLMRDSLYQQYIVRGRAKHFGRCNPAGTECYLFASPAEAIRQAVQKSMKAGKHDAAVLGKALSLPADNFNEPLHMITIDLSTVPVCVRLPVDDDQGAYKCKSSSDKDCFKFGGYTWGGTAELMVLNAPVDKAKVEDVP